MAGGRTLVPLSSVNSSEGCRPARNRDSFRGARFARRVPWGGPEM